MLTTCIYLHIPSLAQLQNSKELAFAQSPQHANTVHALRIGQVQRISKVKRELTVLTEQIYPAKSSDTHTNKEKSLVPREH